MHNKEVKIISQEELPAQGTYNQPACGWPVHSRDPPQGALGSDLQLAFPVAPLSAASLLGLGILSVPPPVRPTPESSHCGELTSESQAERAQVCLRDKNGSLGVSILDVTLACDPPKTQSHLSSLPPYYFISPIREKFRLNSSWVGGRVITTTK